MSIIDFSKNLENVILENELTEVASVLKNEYAISKSDDLQKALNEIEEEGRILKIGIIGRVKAGKSSLLNALVFDGEDILPKAATPMTAALTILEYAEKPTAEIDFLSQEDIDDIKKEHDEYLKLIERITQEKFKEAKDKKKFLKDKNEDELLEKAKRQAEREAKKNDKLFSSYDQYIRIKNAGISLQEVSDNNIIEAQSNEELNKQLKEFVSADGKYMPFTKSVTLKLNTDRLKDLQIIDTPGVNDPVTSREERTKELLKYCDVVFIVSPAGQFLSSEDIGLLDRVSSKEGVNEIHLIASQIDLQLFGSEKNEANGVMPKALENIVNGLSGHVKSIFEKDDDLKNTKSLKQLTQNSVMYSSGICYSLLKKFDQQENWDANEKHVWEMLSTQYKDYFSNKESALANLQKLANIENIQQLLERIREKKESILGEKKTNFLTTKHKVLQDYNTSLIKHMQEKIARVQDSDINEVRKQKENLENIQTNASTLLNDEYSDIIVSLELGLKGQLKDKAKSYFRKTRQGVQDSEGSETETWTTGMWWWKKNHSRTYTTIKAGFVRNALEELTDDVERMIDEDAKAYMLDWKKKLYKTVVSLLRQEAGDENLDIPLISQTIRKVLNSIHYPEIVYSGDLPKSLQVGGTLEGRKADSFIAEAQNYLSDLRVRVTRDIDGYLHDMLKVLKQINIADEVFKNYKKEIEELENAINNKELILERYRQTLKQLENINE